MDIIQKALDQKKTVLSEHESKECLKTYGIPVVKEAEVCAKQEVLESVSSIGFPLVMKACQPGLSHKTEQGLVFVDIYTEQQAISAFENLMGEQPGQERSVLISEKLSGQREVMSGLITDSQFGPCVMYGLGGILTELLADTVFRILPISSEDAFDMLQEISCPGILDALRGLPAIDKEQLKDILLGLNQIAMDYEIIREMDINPVVLSKDGPQVVDALIVLQQE